jgi:hypothetical protein
MMRPTRKPFVSLIAAGLVCCTIASATSANFAPRFLGDVASEAWGIKEVAIVHEQLAIDLRPVVRADLARVDVTYELINSGASKHLDLLFVSGEVGLSEFEARLDGKPMQIRVLPSDEAAQLWKRAPASWRPPDKSPGLERDEAYYAFRNYGREKDLVEISLELPSGASTLTVHYLAHACGTAERATVTWQFPYVLAPAREWGGFGRLDVVVYLPSGWEARSTPALTREADTLRGNFEGVPADALLIATGAPVPTEYGWAVRFSVALWIVLLVGGPLMCWWAGRRQGLARIRSNLAGTQRLFATRLRRALVHILPAILWAFLIYSSVPLSIGIIRASLHSQENPSFGDPWFAGPCMNWFIVPAVILLGVAITRTASWTATAGSPAGAAQ